MPYQPIKNFGDIRDLHTVALVGMDGSINFMRFPHFDSPSIFAALLDDHHILPHPTVFVADTSGKIRFGHVNSDYKVRLEPAKVLEAARAAKN